MNQIHPTAIIAPDAQIGEHTTIGPFAIIESRVTVGAHCEVAAHAILKRGTTLGNRVHVDHHAVLGGLPQDIGFDPGTPSGVSIGDNTCIRECATIHRATKAGANTCIGAGCFLMALSHVAHDCVLADNVIVANTALLAGHVHVGSHAFVSGGVVIHQFVRIGESVMCSGNGRFGMDIPPFVIAFERNHIAGLNLVGLRRRGFTREIITDLKNCYRAVYEVNSLNFPANATAALASALAQTDQGRQFLHFFTEESSLRCQFVRPRHEGASAVK